ncbi:MAG: DUF262 domain-containing HNH endonuclease family protein [Helicobacter bilis]|uniref:DUF262 domain-containing protein n=1 Tax=Helicobacter bilis TaxID=37372 RepID=UPI0026EB8BB8|nr:DUF262 domain-containing HNH endonuclease family protein [Helicobacter bilis]MDD7296233.1 DUF262 domain-containing HNH endonuclease family protein [Helicobacter bilis]
MQKTVADVFNGKCFSIPKYQRDYAWEKKNLDDLWEDLLEAKNASNDSMGHFLGTIVVAKDQNSDVYHIIDGQQRSTTIFMLRYALNAKTKDPAWNMNNFRDENKELRLQVAPANQEFFKALLTQADNNKRDTSLKDRIETDGQKRLYKVFEAIWDRVCELESTQAKEYLSVLDKMVLMWLEEKDSGRAIRTFQSVNDRGVPLLLLDKLKALLILYSNKYSDDNGVLDNTINERFGEIFKIVTQIRNHKLSSSLADRDFGKETETRIFNYHALGQESIGHYSYGAEESFKKIKELLKSKTENPQELLAYIDTYSSDLLEFFKAFYRVMQRTETSAEAFKLLYILKINPYFYSSLVRLEINRILDDECLRLLAQAEVFFYGCGSTNASRAYKLYQAADTKNSFKEKIIQDCKKCATKGGYSSVSDVLRDIARENYDWGKYFHYLFFAYRCENMDARAFNDLLNEDTNKTMQSYEIEHIVPLNAIENGSLKQYGFETDDEFNSVKNYFGNLLILEGGLNSKMKDGGAQVKKEAYKKSKIPYNRSFAEELPSFGKKRIEEENKKFTQWAREFFKEFL